MTRRAVIIDCQVGSTTSRKRQRRAPVERRLAPARGEVAEDHPVLQRANPVEPVDHLVEGVVRGPVGARPLRPVLPIWSSRTPSGASVP